MSAFYSLLPWIVQATIKGSVTIAIMAAAHALVGRRLRARWWCVLWLIALVRLAAPTAPAVGWSLFNFLPPHPAIEWQLRAPAATIVFDAVRQRTAVPWWIAGWKWLVPAWFAGFAVILGRMAVSTIRMRALVMRARGNGGATHAGWDIVEEARAQLYIRRKIVVIESPLFAGPALHGVLCPALLLPEGMCGTFDRDELRHVVLHELAHLRRHDVAVNWLVNAVRALHWFNPLVWLAVARIQEERELACDELTLSCLHPQERLGYGRTILKLVEHFRSAGAVPALVGIVNQKQQMRRRLLMIRNDGRPSPLALPILATLSAIVFMALTDAPAARHATLDLPVLGTLDRFERRIDIDVTNATLTDLLHVITSRCGVTVTQSSALEASDVQRARFTVRACNQPAAAVLSDALRPYGVVPVPTASGLTLTTGPPCFGGRPAKHH
jgi:beta-lactamase regulating signal transducer with metallopeptidase domain